MTDYQILGFVMVGVALLVMAFGVGREVGRAEERVRTVAVRAERDEAREQLSLHRRARAYAFDARRYQFADANILAFDRPRPGAPTGPTGPRAA